MNEADRIVGQRKAREAAAQQRAADDARRLEEAKKQRLIAKIDAEIPKALARLKQNDYRGADAGEFYDGLFGRKVSRAYWVLRSWTYYHDDVPRQQQIMLLSSGRLTNGGHVFAASGLAKHLGRAGFGDFTETTLNEILTNLALS